MRIKTVFYCLSIALVVLLAGCSQKEKDYSEVIDAALATNQELIAQYDWDPDFYGFERENSHIMIWEDEYNYFVYLRKNYLTDIYGDGYKIGKENHRGSSAPADRAEIVRFFEDNVPCLYEETNIVLNIDSMDMR